MRKILIASHGKLASGLLSSIELLAGIKDGIVAIDAYVDDNDFEKELNQFIDSVSNEDEIFIFTDLFGGSVNQKITKRCLEEGLAANIISGMNLPVILEVLLAGEDLTKEGLNEIVQRSQQELTVNILEDLNLVAEEDEEEVFF
ncbi:PTS fructose transporter subunit IIA [Streptococcaceae bacterium ESL0687]|nr:PTS fructose transporter subunit IIA [Streptococcaceae bacterium ESL0687]